MLNGPAPVDPPELWPVLWRHWGDADAPGGVAWDVGANCGQTIGILTERFDKVHAFEPELDAYDALCDHILQHKLKDRVRAHACAMSDRDGEVGLIALPEKLETGQLVSAESEGMEFDASKGEIRNVPCSTADSMAESIGYPQFMKIDVEGHELRVLEGARVVLDETHPDLLIEIHSEKLGEQVRELLTTRYGYDVNEVRHPYYEQGSEHWKCHYWLRASVDGARARLAL